MKILWVDLAPRSGAQASYALLLRAMATQSPQDEHVVLCPIESSYWPLGELPNVRVSPFTRGLLAEPRRLAVQTSLVARIARDQGADVIVTTNLGPYVRTGVAQVLIALNAFQFYPWSVSRHHPRSRFSLAVLRWFFRRSVRCCDAVQVETDVARDYIARIPGAPSLIATIPKAVDSDDDEAEVPLSAHLRRQFDGGLGAEAFTCLYVATALPHKNHATVVAAMEVLRAQRIPARLMLSATPEQLAGVCSFPLLSSLMATGHVVPIGWLDKKDLSAVYRASDACVMPSFVEQLSSAHLEAMQWRRPQVSADLDFGRALCGDAAIYAQPQSPSDWAAKIRLLMEDPRLRERLVAAGSARMQSFPVRWSEVARRQRDFLSEVVARHLRPTTPASVCSGIPGSGSR